MCFQPVASGTPKNEHMATQADGMAVSEDSSVTSHGPCMAQGVARMAHSSREIETSDFVSARRIDLTTDIGSLAGSYRHGGFI